uniref:PAS domain-containing protein n=1 Tax=Heterorhabditis bacteriophora TaxID=37862 RepID=A0A1I7WVP3_HETBA
MPPGCTNQQDLYNPVCFYPNIFDKTLICCNHSFFRVHAMLELDESELPVSFYHLVHVEDAVCLAEAHKEVIKNGSSGLLIYRLISTKTNRTYFVQSSCRMFYKNGKPESIGLTHRLLK